MSLTDDIQVSDLVQEAIPVQWLMDKIAVYQKNIDAERATAHPSYNYIKLWQDNINYITGLIVEYRASKIIKEDE